MREKEFGIWQSVTWADYFDNVGKVALGLLELGYEPGDKMAILGDNRPEWLYSELAIQSLGGAAVGIFPDSHVTQVKYIIDHSDAVFLVVEDQEQADKFLEIRDECPSVKKIIVDDPTGMRNTIGQFSSVWRMSWKWEPNAELKTVTNLRTGSLRLMRTRSR